MNFGHNREQGSEPWTNLECKFLACRTTNAGSLLSSFPSVGRHDFDWVTQEEFDGFLPELILWILLVDQQQLETIVN
jgi:hypothetical protein